MNTLKEVLFNTIAVCCVQLLHCLILVLYIIVSGTTEPVFIAVYSSVALLLFYVAPFFMFGTLISIMVLPKISQVIISQLLFIIIVYVVRINMGANDTGADDIDIISNIILLFFVTNVGSILLVVLVKFAHEIYAWCIYRLQGK